MPGYLSQGHEYEGAVTKFGVWNHEFIGFYNEVAP